MRQAVVHIGMPKTGTTAIQDYLDLAREQLPGVGIPRQMGGRNHVFLAVAASAGKAREALSRKLGVVDPHAVSRAELAKLRDLAAKHQKTVMSSEYLYDLRTRSEIDSLRSALGAMFERVKIVLYLRRQDKQIESQASQHVKAGMTDLSRALNFSPVRYDYLKVCHAWSGTFGEQNLVVREYDSCLPDVVADFCRQAEIPYIDGLIQNNSNRSFDLPKMKAFVRISAAINDQPNLTQQERESLRRRIAAAMSHIPNTDVRLELDAKTRKRIIDTFSEANAAVEEQFMDNQRFPAP